MSDQEKIIRISRLMDILKEKISDESIEPESDGFRYYPSYYEESETQILLDELEKLSYEMIVDAHGHLQSSCSGKTEKTWC